MKNPIDAFRDHVNNTYEQVERFAFFVRAKEMQEASIKTLEGLLAECKDGKCLAVKEQNDNDANAFLAFEFMTMAFIEEFRFYLALKDDDADKAWDHLVNAQSSAANAMKSHAVASHLDTYIERLYALERLLFPRQVFFSSSFIVKESECSICGAEYGDCDHIKGRPYMGKLCFGIVKKAAIQEISIVSDPADKHCRAINFADNGVERNVLTQRAIKKDIAKQGEKY